MSEFKRIFEQVLNEEKLTVKEYIINRLNKIGLSDYTKKKFFEYWEREHEKYNKYEIKMFQLNNPIKKTKNTINLEIDSIKRKMEKDGWYFNK